MNRMLSCSCLLFTFFLLSCSKSENNSANQAFYGQWQFIGSAFGPSFTKPAPDSVVILTLKSDNTYAASLNGKILIHGPLTIENDQNFQTLKFVNIDQPYGNNTSGSSNGVNFLFFNTAKIGQLVLFQDNSANIQGDTLNLISFPITPDPTLNNFKRVN
jgi:hypothetical protein